ncbi:MAG: SCO family protein [Gammaproteobacteria bacterium]|nr:SCO family protein [Pseudomonadales bacterium]MCP5347784.1 SCO family protein [Pseudomonadales bacterium]
MTRRQRILLAFGAFDALLFALLVGLFLVRPEPEPVQDSGIPGVAGFAEPVELQNFRLVDQHGNPFTRDDLLGAWHLVFFGFTSCPDICPYAMQALESFYRDLDPATLQRDTGVIMVSVDPLRDTPQVMADFVGRFHPDFVGLTGEYPQIAALAQQLYFAFSKPGEHSSEHGGDYEIPHSDYIGVIDPQGRYRGLIHGPHSADRLSQAYSYFRN